VLRVRVMPCLLLKGWGLVKTVRFKAPNYVGDPINTVRIFNELEVDELILLDIDATPKERPIQFKLLEEIASECFMPITYGGGIRSLEDMQTIFNLGVEKVSLNSGALNDLTLISRAAERFGSQSIVVSIDARKDFFGKYRIFSRGGRQKHTFTPADWARRVEAAGAGEILLTSMDRDGTFGGYDLELLRPVTSTVSIPVIANGGAARVEDFRLAVRQGGASALGAGSMVVYQGPNKAVLTNFPPRERLSQALEE